MEEVVGGMNDVISKKDHIVNCIVQAEDTTVYT